MENESTHQNHAAKEQDLDFLKIQYQILSSREISHDNIVWNTPSMLFVGESLMWTIALSGNTPAFIRCLVSLVSIVISILCLQFFQRGQYNKIIDAEQLLSIEQTFAHAKGQSGRPYLALTIFDKQNNRTVIKGGEIQPISRVLTRNPLFRDNFLSRIQAYSIWKFSFYIAIFLSIVIFLFNLAGFVETLPMLPAISPQYPVPPAT